MVAGIFSSKKTLKAWTLLDKIMKYKKLSPDGLIFVNKAHLSISNAKALALSRLIKWGSLTLGCALGVLYCLSKKTQTINA